MVEYEYFDLPEQEIRNKNPVLHEINPDAWPNQRLVTGLWWNNASQEWHFGVSLLGFGKIIPVGPAKLNTPYSYRDYIRIIFYDPAEKASRITPRNLASRIRMTVWPGPESEAYEPRIIERPLLGEVEEEPWREIIGYEQTTKVVEEPLPLGENE